MLVQDEKRTIVYYLQYLTTNKRSPNRVSRHLVWLFLSFHHHHKNNDIGQVKQLDEFFTGVGFSEYVMVVGGERKIVGHLLWAVMLYWYPAFNNKGQPLSREWIVALLLVRRRRLYDYVCCCRQKVVG